MTQYDLSRSFWDFAFENPEKVKPTHIAMYFFAIEHCNRLGWKTKFGLPTSMVIDAVGLKSYNTYKKHFDELVEWGFFKVYEYSKNQYSSNIIALSLAISKNNKALDKATSLRSIKKSESTGESTVQSTGESTGSIDKPITNNLSVVATPPKQTDNFSEEQHIQYNHFIKWIATNTPEINKLPKPITIKEFLILSGQVKNSSGQFMQISGIEIKEILEKIENNKVYLKKYRSPYLCITHWTKNNRTKQNV